MIVLDGNGAITGLTATGISAVQQLPSGSVLQVVQVSYPTQTTTTSTTLSATGVSAIITPKFATSKILMFASMNGVSCANSNNNAHFEIYRNGVSQSYLEDALMNTLTAFGNAGASYQYLDSPASTSALTYAIWWKSQTGGTVYLNNYASGANRTVSAMTLMEIAG